MEYLTVNEAAELKGCSIRYINRILKNGKLKAEIMYDPEIKQERYMIPVTALPDELKAKYYAKVKKETGTAPELLEKTPLKSDKKVVKKAFEEYSEAERNKMAEWIAILKEWQHLRAGYKKKTEFDADYIGKCRIEHPDLTISKDILYRKYAAYIDNDLDGLIDHRGGHNRGQSSIDERVWEMFASLYLSFQNPQISVCYKRTVAWCETHHPELVAGIPSERSFRRRAERELKGAVASWVRDGEKKCLAKFGIHAERNYTDLEANDVWIFDNHTLDIISLAPNGKPHRMSLTAIQDAKSGVIVGFNPCDDPCSESTLFAMHRAVIDGYGLCRYAYLDNGSEFCAADIAGSRGHRKWANWNKDDTPPAIFELLGIKAQFALVANPDAKNIERFFYTFKEHFSKATDGYCGGTQLERHPTMNKRVKNQEIPTDEEVIRLLDVYVKSYNSEMYGGKETKYKGMSRIDVWNESVNSDRVNFRDVASEEDLALLLARSTRFQKIKRNGVYVNMYGKKIWFKNDDTVFNIDKEVYIRYDPYDLSSVRVYDKDTDKYLWTYPRADYLDVPFLAADDSDGKEKIAAYQENYNRTRKAVKAKFDSYKNSPNAIDYVAAAINEMELNAKKYEIKKPQKFEPVTAQEINVKYPERENIINVDYSELEELRAMNDRLETARKGA